jgi:3-isopropylmalate dehydrogenase
MMLRYSLQCEAQALRVEQAVSRVLQSGARTADIARGAQAVIGTQAMGDRVIAAL